MLKHAQLSRSCNAWIKNTTHGLKQAGNQITLRSTFLVCSYTLFIVSYTSKKLIYDKIPYFLEKTPRLLFISAYSNAETIRGWLLFEVRRLFEEIRYISFENSNSTTLSYLLCLFSSKTLAFF